ncbi:hypothetical protein F66182_12256 [Fusarium sp. NRRL 66182]|nr:hypothetical protein F66182_12256 [Fusarium sp. NRRL 66182]
MESVRADPFDMFKSPFPSRHLTAAQDLQIQEQIQFPVGEYVSYVISGSQAEIEYEEVSIDTTDFIQGTLTTSLVFSAKIGGIADDPVITWFVFHHKDHDNHAVEFFRWVLSGYGYTIESDITSLLLRAQASERTRTMQTICSRAYGRSMCYQSYWPLYPRLVYLLYLTGEKINQDGDSSSGESGDEES